MIAVVLAVVEFAGLESGIATAAVIDGDPDLEQLAVVLPAAELGADTATEGIWSASSSMAPRAFGAGALSSCSNQIQSTTSPESALVDGKTRGAPKPRSPCARRHRSRPRGWPEHTRRADRPLEQLAGVVVTAGVDRDEALPVGAATHRVQGRGQPTNAVMGNEHRGDDVTGADQTVVSDGR